MKKIGTSALILLGLLVSFSFGEPQTPQAPRVPSSQEAPRVPPPQVPVQNFQEQQKQVPLTPGKCPTDVVSCPYKDRGSFYAESSSSEPQGQQGSQKESQVVSTKKKEKDKKSEFLSAKIPSSAVRAEPISGNAFIVRPEVTTLVNLSATDINRFVCTEELEQEVKVVFPKRKGVNVKTAENNVFVEFEIIKKGDEYEYQEGPVEFYMVCDKTVYSIIGIPSKIPAVTVYLENKAKEVEKKLEAVLDQPYEKRLISIVKALYSGKIPVEAEYLKVDKSYDVYSVLSVKETSNYVFSAEGLVARVFVVSLKDEAKADYVDLRERDFLKKELVLQPVAVSIDRLRLRKGEKAQVIVIEKKNVISQEIFKMGD